ncbi:MAG: hypothetical protein IKL57_02175 [Oscillospiraceae bacterium]|nr:hypothetical protein [Oscillospiraceae bacterium]
MKKSSFVAMILGTVSTVLFALGMCMALLPEWDSFTEGIIFGTVGLVMGLITLIIWRKMEHKAPIKLNGKNVLFVIFAVIGALILGTGMCFCLVWENLVFGTIIGLAGILMLLSLIPIVKGIK